ncbi:ABC transporter B family member 1-like, partial [Trifolium medium]|nr:ABC transporter B family member 1-like [Trifolium medium]
MIAFVSGFVVGFTAVWHMALVTLVVPMIAVVETIHTTHTTTLAKLSSKSQEVLSQASNIVEHLCKSESQALQDYSEVEQDACNKKSNQQGNFSTVTGNDTEMIGLQEWLAPQERKRVANSSY